MGGLSLQNRTVYYLPPFPQQRRQTCDALQRQNHAFPSSVLRPAYTRTRTKSGTPNRNRDEATLRARVGTPTATCHVLFVFVVLCHNRRRVVHLNVTEHPPAEWTTQQVVDAFPWDTAPRYVLRDRDQIYGAYFDRRVAGLGIEQVLTVPRSPWQNPFVERLIGSIRRECLDHMIILGERHLRRMLREYLDYYHSCRTHLSLVKDAPDSRPVEPSEMGKVITIPKVSGLHH